MKIFVGNLSSAVNDAELEQVFANHGSVISSKVIVDKFTGASRGFGFVEMSDNDAENAIRSLNGTTVQGSAIRVNEARPQEQGFRSRSAGFNNNRAGYGGRDGAGGNKRGDGRDRGRS